MVKTETSNTTLSSNSNNNNQASQSQCKKRYKGVRMRSWGSWVSEIRAPNQKTRIWLGSYSTAEAAARAYDAALLCLKPQSTNLNFPHSKIPHHPENTVMSPKSIQRVAAAAAANAENSSLQSSFCQSTACSTSSSTTTTTSFSESNSSPSLSASSPNSSCCFQIENDRIYLEEDYKVQLEEPSVLLASDSSWYMFDSPKYNEMVNGAFFDPNLMMEDCYHEDNDIRLWSYC